MDSMDQPAQPAIDQAAQTSNAPSGFRRTVLSAGMAAALLVAGGVAVVSAASPDPSAPPKPVTTTSPATDDSASGSSNAATRERGDCPAEDGRTSTTPTPPT